MYSGVTILRKLSIVLPQNPASTVASTPPANPRKKLFVIGWLVSKACIAEAFFAFVQLSTFSYLSCSPFELLF